MFTTIVTNEDTQDLRMKPFFDLVASTPALDDASYYPVDEQGRFDAIAYFDKVTA